MQELIVLHLRWRRSERQSASSTSVYFGPWSLRSCNVRTELKRNGSEQRLKLEAKDVLPNINCRKGQNAVFWPGDCDLGLQIRPSRDQTHLPCDLPQIRSAVSEIFHTQPKKTTDRRPQNRTFCSSLHVVMTVPRPQCKKCIDSIPVCSHSSRSRNKKYSLQYLYWNLEQTEYD